MTTKLTNKKHYENRIKYIHDKFCKGLSPSIYCNTIDILNDKFTILLYEEGTFQFVNRLSLNWFFHRQSEGEYMNVDLRFKNKGMCFVTYHLHNYKINVDDKLTKLICGVLIPDVIKKHNEKEEEEKEKRNSIILQADRTIEQ